MAEREVISEMIEEAVATAKQSGQVIQQTGKYGTAQSVYKGTNGVTVVIENEGRNAKVITLYKNGGGGI